MGLQLRDADREDGAIVNCAKGKEGIGITVDLAIQLESDFLLPTAHMRGFGADAMLLTKLSFKSMVALRKPHFRQKLSVEAWRTFLEGQIIFKGRGS